MTAPVRHDSFTITRTLDAPPEAVFALWEDETRWRRWFRMPGSNASYRHDLRVGGQDEARSSFAHSDGRTENLENRATYLVIERDRRIVYSSVSIIGGSPRWASLVTVELDFVDPASTGGPRTELRWTEQAAFVAESERPQDDLPHLRGAIQLRLNALVAALDD